MLTYHILYNPHAGSGRGQEATYRLNVLLPDDRLLFRDITEIYDYGATHQFQSFSILAAFTTSMYFSGS